MVGVPSLHTLPLILGISIGLMAGMALFFEIRLDIIAGYERSVDPSYPYLHAIGLHDVKGKPFMYYLSRALEENRASVDGVDVAAELERFGETFALKNSTGGTVVAVGNAKGKNAYLAVPPGGYLAVVSDG